MSLQGTIDSFPIIDVLRLLAISSKPGRFVVDGDRGVNELWFVDGNVTGGKSLRGDIASDPESIGVVMFDLLRSTNGSFLFEDSPLPKTTGQSLSVDSLIEHAQVEIDEWSEIVKAVPSMQHHVALEVELGSDTVTLDRRMWEGVLTVGLGASVDTIGTRLGSAELTTLRLVRDLLDLGLVTLSEPALDSSTIRSFGDIVADAPGAGFEDLLAEVGEPPAVGDTTSVRLFSKTDGPVPTIKVDPQAQWTLDQQPRWRETESAEVAGHATLDEILDRIEPTGEIAAEDLARQMSLMSPRAARALASANEHGATTDTERDRLSGHVGWNADRDDEVWNWVQSDADELGTDRFDG